MKTPYGTKRDYRKIDIYVDGEYVGSTTWACNRGVAKDRFIERHPDTKAKHVTTEYA